MQFLKTLEQHLSIIIPIVIGWFLGYITTLLNQWRERKRLRKEFEKTISVELKEITTRFVGNYWVLANDAMQANRGNLAWLDSMVSVYPGELPDVGVKVFKELLKLSDDELAKAAMAKGKIRSIFLQKFNLPFLEKNITSLALLGNSSLQASILAVRRNIGWLNANVDRNNFFYEKSFDQSMSVENRKIMVDNMEDTYIIMADLCRKTADHCNAIILKLDQ